ncbi:Sodium/hydrogen exchanger family protein [Apiospora kogelbergensis]|uniref:Sodium/hydrogen exchanger family protein n=1 Tax=Apiospora kogelbergensis TaxID=1337665 RepID=A0AAW0R598_9PEZI
MPSLDVSELNIVISVFGTFIILYGFVSVKIKQVWFLGEALPAVILGIILGPLAARFIDAERWGSAAPEQQHAITLGVTRVMIGLQLVIAGFQLPAKYQLTRWKEMLLCLIPIMTVMWLCTTACILLTVPKLTLLAALVIGSCVTCTDPILSQAIAKGPFADRYVARDLREIISSEAGANDGFGFPFLMLAVYLMRHSELGADVTSHEGVARRSEEVGRLGGGVGVALGNWVVETWLYIVLMSIAYGAVVGYGCRVMTKFGLRKRWIDSESYLLYPTAMGLFLVGTCGAIGTDDLLACFVAGNALNWDGQFLEETEKRHDEVNSSVDVLLNFGGFLYIGTVLPWSEFHQPELTGITYPRLVGLGFLVLVLRRIPAILMFYKCMPNVCKNIKEALFMGYFGPIGAGAVFYLEHTRHLFPELEKADEGETNLLRAIGPVVYWLVLFSIVVHGLSIPALNLVYRWYNVQPISTDAVEIKRSSVYVPAPANAVANDSQTFLAYNRFSRPVFNQGAVLPRSQPDGKAWDSDADSFVEILDKSRR